MPAKKSTGKRTTAKKSPGRKTTAKKSSAKKSTARKSTGTKSTANTSSAGRSASRKSNQSRKSSGSKKKSAIKKMIGNPKRTAREAVGVARKTADRTREVGEKMVGASELVKKAIDVVDTMVSGGRRRGRRSNDSGESESGSE